MKQQIKSIDGIRGIASIFIVIFHYFCVFCEANTSLVPIPEYTQYFFLYSQYGVEVFFMLSGFLISYNYKTTLKNGTLKEFFHKRFDKLVWPVVAVNLWAFLNICLKAKYLEQCKTIPLNLWRFFQSIIMMCTGWADNNGPIASTMWFVNVLLLCYIIYYGLNVRISKHIDWLIACSIMVTIGYICTTKEWDIPFLYNNSGRGYTSFFLGALIYEFQEKVNKKKREKIAISVIICLFASIMLSAVNGIPSTFGTDFYKYFVFVISPTIIIAALNLNFAKRFFEWRGFVWLGGLSMSLYYVHNNVMVDYTFVDKFFGLNLNFNSIKVFIVIIVSMIPFAVLWNEIAKTWGRRIRGGVIGWFNS